MQLCQCCVHDLDAGSACREEEMKDIRVAAAVRFEHAVGDEEANFRKRACQVPAPDFRGST